MLPRSNPTNNDILQALGATLRHARVRLPDNSCTWEATVYGPDGLAIATARHPERHPAIDQAIRQAAARQRLEWPPEADSDPAATWKHRVERGIAELSAQITAIGAVLKTSQEPTRR